MNKTLKLPVLLLGFIVMLGTSCKKYDEGSSFSIKTIKGRLAKTWEVEKWIDENGEETKPESKSDVFTMKINKDGTGVYSGLDTLDQPYKEEFNWILSKDCKKLYFYEKAEALDIGVTFAVVEEIILLKNKQLGLKDADGSKTYYKKK